MAATNPKNTDAVPQVFHGLKSLKSTKYGTPLLGDTWDLFCSLLFSLQISTRKQAFKTFPYAFTGDEAVKSLASLDFVRSPDSQNQIFTTTTAKIFLEEDDAGTLMQHFLAGHMIKESRDDSLPLFRKKGIYQFTFKGLRILEETIEDNGIETEADHLIEVLSTLPMPRPKLWRLERRKEDDEIIVNPSIITNLFLRVAGRKPNYVFDSNGGVHLIPMDKKNTLLKPLHRKGSEPFGWKVTLIETTHCFKAPILLKYLGDSTTVTSSAEAAEMAAHLVRLGLITLVVDNAKKKDFLQIFKVNGYAPSGNPFISEEGEFRFSMSAIYAITDEGSRLAGWPGVNAPPLLPPLASNSTDTPAQISSTEPGLHSQALVNEIVNGVNGMRMKKFVKDANIRALFSEYLRKELCAYLLSFWIDIEDLKDEFTTSKASTILPEMPPVASSSRTPLERMSPQQHHGPLNNRPFFIYNTYLSPSSEYQLGNWIARALRTELQTALEDMLETLTNRALVADMELVQETTLDSFQLEILMEIYDRIQAQVFCILAVDFVPRFIKSPEFLERHLQDLQD